VFPVRRKRTPSTPLRPAPVHTPYQRSVRPGSSPQETLRPAGAPGPAVAGPPDPAGASTCPGRARETGMGQVRNKPDIRAGLRTVSPRAGKPGTPAPRRAGSPDPGGRGRGRESGINRLPDAPGAGTSDTDNGTARPSRTPRTPRHRLPRHQIVRDRDTAQRHGAEARGQKTLPSKHGPPGKHGTSARRSPGKHTPAKRGVPQAWASLSTSAKPVPR
jgi:hypothetical protein